MWPILGGLLTGGMNLLGGLFSSQTSAANTQAQIQAQEGMQLQSQAFNREQAQVQRDWQTQMSNTAYQRASADMKAAGLNPMMMFGSGAAAGTPSGAVASSGTPSVPMPQNTHPFARIGEAARSMIDGIVSAKTVEKMGEEIAKLKTAQQVDKAEEYATRELGDVRREEVPHVRLKAASEGYRRDILHHQVPQEAWSARKSKVMLDAPDAEVIAGEHGRYIGQSVAPLASTAKDLFRGGVGSRWGSWRDNGDGNWFPSDMVRGR